MKKIKWVPVVRWTARVWSLFPILYALGLVIFPDSEPEVDVMWTEWLALGLIGVVLIGLAIAFVWEKIGAVFALVALAVFTIVFMLTVERNFPMVLVFIFGLGIPAGMFLAVADKGKKPLV